MTKRLKRNSKDVIIAGVCGGIAEYIKLDPTIVRIIWVILSIVSFGTFLLIYIVLWVIMPINKSK
jgi:phage shock protein C